eukprot:COSAG05_NODE_12076_length_484_cov_2.779221_1_plen_122_part_01
MAHGSPIVPPYSIVCPYHARKSRIRYVVLARGGHSEKFVWSMLTIAVGRGRLAASSHGSRAAEHGHVQRQRNEATGVSAIAPPRTHAGRAAVRGPGRAELLVSIRAACVRSGDSAAAGRARR